MSFRIHFLVPDSNGPVVSEPGGSTFKVGRSTRSKIARKPALQMSEIDRATGEPWQVVCNACKATQAYKDAYYPRPQQGNIEFADPGPEVESAAIPKTAAKVEPAATKKG